MTGGNSISATSTILLDSARVELLPQTAHNAEACRLRAAQLTFWKRVLDLASLAIVPGAVMIITVRDSEFVRFLGITLSAIGGVASWGWAMFAKVFEWDAQLKACVKSTAKSHTLTRQLEMTVAQLESANSAEKEKAAQDELQKLTREYDWLMEEIDEAQIPDSDIHRLIAQQAVLRRYPYVTCGECGQVWTTGTEIFVRPWPARVFLNRIDKRMICSKCGQSRTITLDLLAEPRGLLLEDLAAR